MIVDCAVYENGHRRGGDLELMEAYQACRNQDVFRLDRALRADRGRVRFDQVTVRHGETALHDVRLRMEERPDLLRYGPGAAPHAIVDRVVDDYHP
jgi:hypothetical protein